MSSGVEIYRKIILKYVRRQLFIISIDIHTKMSCKGNRERKKVFLQSAMMF